MEYHLPDNDNISLFVTRILMTNQQEALNRVEEKFQVILEIDGNPLIDSQLASILKLIEERGSLFVACRSLGIPYSREEKT